MERYESPVDRAIREAAERGEFDDLPGAGKPLQLRRSGDPDWWLKDLVEREGISVGGAVSLRREADSFPESLADLPTEQAVRAVLEDFNQRVKDDWRRPGVGKGSPVVARLVDVDDVVQQWHRMRREGRSPS
ncbi:MAG: DUF1992 domain-containing protein [Actinobacteria bacterium]|jgi:hypothetical protein|nr:DUF1992 domain-containing protein [Actinomycetota bacterium]